MTTHDDRLTDLLVMWDEAEERGEKPTVAGICHDCPEMAGPLTDLLRTLGRVEQALEQTVPFSPPARERLPRLVGRYRLTRLIGHGGLGDVYGADDTELPREVAVKLIRADVTGEEARRRFAHEAAITSRLDHPGVVPVFGFHAPDGGPPYYAMRLIRGRSLAEEIAAWHAAQKEGGPAEESDRELRRLLRNYVTACQTIAYAHSRGVIHRDLKPQNIMVGPYGETLVVDWGLAKQLAAEPSVAATARDDEPTQLPCLDARVDGKTGTVGTLEYMSPEQFHGEATTACDIYSLGATLWKLLAGQSRLAASSDSERMRLVSSGYYVPPEKLRPGTPPGLSAACAKAMAVRPEDRYATVSDLVDDVEAWLADQPLAAYPDPWHVSLRRWAVARLPYLSAAGGLLAAAAIAMAIIVALVQAHNDRIAADAEELRKNYALAHQATREMMLTAVQNPKLMDASHNPVRREILERAIRYYRRALELRPDSLEIRRELALATMFLGFTEHHLALQPEIPKPLFDAEEQYRSLAAEHPADLDLAYGHIVSQHLIASAAFDLERFPETVKRLMAVYPAVAALPPFPAGDSGEIEVRRIMGEPRLVELEAVSRLSLLANLPAGKAHEAQVRKWMQGTLDRFTELDRQRGGKDRELRAGLAQLHFNLANNAFMADDMAATERELLATRALLPKAAGGLAPQASEMTLENQIQLGLSQVYLRTGRTKEAIAELEPAFASLAPLLDNFDGIISQNLLPPRMACDMLQRLMDVSMRLLNAENLESSRRVGLGPAIGDLGEESRRKAKHVERMRAIARSLPLLVKHFPKVAADNPALDVLAMTSAGNLLEHLQHDDALAVLEAADAILKVKLAADPKSRELAMRQTQVWILQGMAYAEKEAEEEAAKRFAAALPRLRALTAEAADPLLEQFLVPTCWFLAGVADSKERFAEGSQLVEEMLAAAERRLADPANRFAYNHAQLAVGGTVHRGVILTAPDSPAGKEDRAAVRRLALAALDILDKLHISFENGAEYRALLEKR